MSRLKLSRAIVWIDLETTGLDARRDRIIEISVIREAPSGELEEKTKRVNPEMAIDPGAIEVHGITDADVRDEPTFDRVAKAFAEFLEDADIGGFGITRFDIPLLINEFQRVNVPFSMEGRAVIDAKTIYHKNEPRDLSAASVFYLNRELDSAHSAAADVSAAREVLHAQLEKYAELPGDPITLSELYRDTSWIDFEGKIVWKRGEATITFGKHRGKSLKDLANREPEYLRWMLGKDFSPQVTQIIQGALDGQFPQESGAGSDLK